MSRIRFSRSSRKALRRLRRSGRFDEALFAFILNELARGRVLPARYENHSLQGTYAGCFECHIKSDLLLVYEIDIPQNTLSVLDVGSHSELFR